MKKQCENCVNASCGWCFADIDKDEFIANLEDIHFDWLAEKPPEVTRETLCKWVWGQDEKFEPKEALVVQGRGKDDN